jgi:hypothetical protein
MKTELKTKHELVKEKKIITPTPSGGIWAKWGIQVIDPSKNIIIAQKEAPAHSLVRNFGIFIRAMFDTPDGAVAPFNPDVTDITSVSRTIRVKSDSLHTSNVPVIGGSGTVRFGDSAVAEDSAQVNLQGTPMGSSPSGVLTETAISESTTGTTFTVQGQVVNDTGGLFTIEEIVILTRMNDTSATTRDVMILRDLTGPVAVADGLTVLGRYTITINI